MKRTIKATAAALLALTLVCGAPIPGVEIGAPVSVSAEEKTVGDTVPQSGQNDTMWYGIGSNSASYDVGGINGENKINSTFMGGGYSTYLQVGENEKQILTSESLVLGKVYTINDSVQVRITLDFTKSGKGVMIHYELLNTSDAQQTVKIGSVADTQIGNNDEAPITYENNGIKMTDPDSGAVLYMLPGNMDFTTKWFGPYGAHRDYVFTDEPNATVSGDSAMAWSWTLDLAPGESRTLTAIASVSGEELATYTATFDPANGEDSYTRTVFDGDAAVKPTNPVKEGYVLKYWTTDGVNEYDFDTVLTGDITLTAVYDELTKVDGVDPTCEEPGNIEYWTVEGTDRYYADNMGKVEITAEDIPLSALDHLYDTAPAWTWSDDQTSATAKFTCSRNPEHTEDVEATVKREGAVITATANFNNQTYTATVIAKPTFTIKTAFGGRTIQVNCDDPDADIYYSFASSNITTASEKVKDGDVIFLGEPMTGTDACMYFKTYKDGKWSVVCKRGILNVQLDKPLIVQSGKASDNKVKVYTQAKNTFIVYTTDGTDPVIEEGIQSLKITNGKMIWATSGVVSLPKGSTIKAIAIRSGYVTSDVAEYTN
ncbi:MAG: InlB B-repeat-containing protein [Oscillospiraceae bacterium]|nr:InlB B-repeat-containing protein [Oscillospiraceae bacterium]